MEADSILQSALEFIHSDDDSSVLTDSSFLSESSGFSEEAPEHVEVDEENPSSMAPQVSAVSSPKFRGDWHPPLPQPKARDLSWYARPPSTEGTKAYQKKPPVKHNYVPPKPNANFAEQKVAEDTRRAVEDAPKKENTRAHHYNPCDEYANFTGYKAKKATEPRVSSWKKTGKDGYPVVADRSSYRGEHSFLPPHVSRELLEDIRSRRVRSVDSVQEEQEVSEAKSSTGTRERKESDFEAQDAYVFESKSQQSLTQRYEEVQSEDGHEDNAGVLRAAAQSLNNNSVEHSFRSRSDSPVGEKQHRGFEDLDDLLTSLAQTVENASSRVSEDEHYELLDLELSKPQMAEVKLLTSTYSGTVRAEGKQDALRCLLDAHGIEYEEIDGALTFLPEMVAERERLFNISGIRGNYPQLFVDYQFVGLFEDVQALNEAGRLRGILKYGMLQDEVANT